MNLKKLNERLDNVARKENELEDLNSNNSSLLDVAKNDLMQCNKNLTRLTLFLNSVKGTKNQNSITKVVSKISDQMVSIYHVNTKLNELKNDLSEIIKAI